MLCPPLEVGRSKYVCPPEKNNKKCGTLWLRRIILFKRANKELANATTIACFFCRDRDLHELTEIQFILARTLQGKGRLIAVYVLHEKDYR